MKIKIFLLAFVLLVINSCKSPKAAEFRESITQKERVAFQIILGKDGPESKKLSYLVKSDFKGAMAAVDEQAREFDKLIKGIKTLSSNGIKEGEPLKVAAINYYRSLKELHFFEHKEIAQQSIISKLDDNDLKMAQDELIDLARQKKLLYTKVYENEHLLSAALDKFDVANGF